MLYLAVFSFLCGIALTLFIIVIITIKLLNVYQGTDLPRPYRIDQFANTFIPKVIEDYVSRQREGDCGTVALNAVLMFLFQEMKGSERLRGWFRKKIELELKEIKRIPTLQLVLRDLRLIGFDLGTSLPIFNPKKVQISPTSTNKNLIQETDVLIDVIYSGEFHFSLEAIVSFDRTIQFTCKIHKLVGEGRLRFSRLPYTNWSFCFTSDAVIALDLQSTVNGRNIPQIIIPILTNQIRRAIRRKHTYPNYKIRTKPFFTGATYNLPVDVKALGRSYDLALTVIGCSRLSLNDDLCRGIFCLVFAGAEKYKPELPYNEKSRTLTLNGTSDLREHGLFLKCSHHNVIKRDAVWVYKVKPASTAETSKITKGDVVSHINGERIISDMAAVRKALAASEPDKGFRCV